MIGWFKKNPTPEQKTPQTSPGALVRLGLEAQHQGDLRQARSAYLGALAIDSRHADAHYLLGTLALGQASAENAIEHVREAIAQDHTVGAYHLTLGIALRLVGDIESALKCFAQAHALDGNDAETLIEFSKTLEAVGRIEEATRAYQRLTELDPTSATHHFTLGSFALARGDAPAAEQCFRRALELSPELAPARINLGNALLGQNRIDEAIENFQRVLESTPDDISALINLAAALVRADNAVEAEKYLRKVVSIDRDAVEAWKLLGAVLRDRGRLAEAEEMFRFALQLRPESLNVLLDLADLLARTGDFQQAEALLDTALRLNPNSATACVGLGQVYKRTHRDADAEQKYRDAIRLDPPNVSAHIGLANLFYDQSRAIESEQYARQALSLNPRSADANIAVGLALMLQGQAIEAETAFRAAIDAEPQNEGAWSQLLLSMNYNSKHEKHTIAALHFQFGANATARVAHLPPYSRLHHERDEKIRIGYISPDFYDHVVSFFIEPVLRNHDRSRFEIHCYYTGTRFDSTQRRLQSLCDHWHHIPAVKTESAVAQIRADELDIAVDLAGHTFGDQLRIFAARVAPIQVTWLGYPNTTGLQTMDWRITDTKADPPDAQALHSERLLHLPDSFLSVREATHAPAIVAPPSEARGFVTFGSFNNHIKISDELLELWARILTSTPGSRLLIKALALKHPTTQEKFRRRAYAAGITENCLQIHEPVQSAAEHLGVYNQVDIALDTFPYNGTTTTTDALWMGVPTVVLAGDRHASRVGVSLLSSVGAEALIACSPDQYVETAVRLANSPDKMAMWRLCLRDRMSNSLLRNNAQFTRNLESAFGQLMDQIPTERTTTETFDQGLRDTPSAHHGKPSEIAIC